MDGEDQSFHQCGRSYDAVERAGRVDVRGQNGIGEVGGSRTDLSPWLYRLAFPPRCSW